MIRAALAALVTAEGRRAWALVFLAGGGAAMTAFAAVALWCVRTVPAYAFYLGAGALALVAIVLTGFAALLVKRVIKGSVLGNSFEISDQVQAAATAAAATAAAVVAASAPSPSTETGDTP